MKKLDEEDARQARPRSMARHALMWGLPIAVIAMAVIYFFYL